MTDGEHHIIRSLISQAHVITKAAIGHAGEHDLLTVKKRLWKAANNLSDAIQALEKEGDKP